MSALVQLHARIDREVRAVSATYADQLACRRGCSGCCRDELTVSRGEAEHIRASHGTLLAEGSPHPEGACAFLDAEGACRIYAERPYVCRTQGLPLRWVERADDEYVEYRDICPLNETIDLVALPETQCWTLGPVEGDLAAISPSGERTALRALFGRAASPHAG